DVLQSLASAATFGAGLQFAVLAAATGRPHERLVNHLDAGLALGIVRETEEPPDDFQFPHELVRRALLGGLTRVRRRRLRQAVTGSRRPSGSHGPGVDLEAGYSDGSALATAEAGALALTLRRLQYAE